MSVESLPPSDPHSAGPLEIVRPKQFYAALQYELTQADSTVDLIHLPPHVPGYLEFLHYNDQVKNIIVEGGLNGYVTVRRMVAIESIEKLIWVLDSMSGVAKKTAFSIRLIDKSCKTVCPKPKTPLPRNVQIIDSRVVFEVDPVRGFHSENEGGAKSVIHRDEDYAGLMVDYYDRWWKMCETEWIKDPAHGINERLLCRQIDSFKKRSSPERRAHALSLLQALMDEYTS